ncbi:hypothetical protein CIT26_08855 [Mesorhizobium temperatum]|uniref:Uncharacterized protein n=1 Tax=Mesorhizobium temperatum TaxID=241416 RepID=A0A271LRB1_9HYPH|nr:hypothetical protein CIT26_08855 [Mesorhizobium temperatum]
MDPRVCAASLRSLLRPRMTKAWLAALSICAALRRLRPRMTKNRHGHIRGSASGAWLTSLQPMSPGLRFAPATLSPLGRGGRQSPEGC